MKMREKLELCERTIEEMFDALCEARTMLYALHREMLSGDLMTKPETVNGAFKEAGAGMRAYDRWHRAMGKGGIIL